MKENLRILEDAVGNEECRLDDGEASSLARTEVVYEMGVLDHDDAKEQIEVNMSGPVVL